MSNKAFQAKTLIIRNIDDVIYDRRDCKYYYKDGDTKHLLDPHHMIIRSTHGGPVVYLDSNDKKLRKNTNVAHPVRCWYATTHLQGYNESREITVARWFRLDDFRKLHGCR